MFSLFLWFLAVLILGGAAFPILYLMFPHLSDRGYGLSKPAGLLVFGYLYWILVSFQLLPNSWTGVAEAFALVLILGGLAVNKVGWRILLNWVTHNMHLVLITEAIFLVLFLFFAFFRAANPEIVGTEKPMEMAFINAILRSPSFPPNDPWLSGYAISYYYFGYVIVAGLIRLTGTISGVGFNLAIALWFAMAGTGSFSLVLNILSGLNHPMKTGKGQESVWKKVGWAILGPMFLIFIANWQGLLEVLHAMGTFWKQVGASWQSPFWSWMDIQELTSPPTLPFGFIPERVSGIWWWRASRVLQDYDLVGNSKEIIDEFPFFSLYLADLHPHILAMPFVFLACGFGLEFYFRARSGKSYETGLFDLIHAMFSGVIQLKVENSTMIPPMQFWGAALVLGGLSFLNTWDFPIYVGLVSAAVFLGRYLANGWEKKRLVEFLEVGISFGLAGVVLFLPFYASFSSQAGGLLPSLAFFTRGIHYWVMFGVLLLPIIFGLLAVYKNNPERIVIAQGVRNSLLVILGFWVAMLLLGLFFVLGTGIAGVINGKFAALISSAAGQFFNLQGSASLRDLLLNTTLTRIISPGGWLTIAGLLTIVWVGILWLRKGGVKTDHASNSIINEDAQSISSSTFPFVLLLIVVGTGLTLFPEFFYLRDQFGWRMNTIFKFYYQTWILWSMAAAVGCYLIWHYSKTTFKWIGSLLVFTSLFVGLIYPFFGMYFRFLNLDSKSLTLDGNAYIATGNPEEVEAINFLSAAPYGTVAEAIGGSYSGYARISTQTGLATVLGWPGHESQWRGGAKEIGSREDDIKRLYQTKDWQETLGILQKYQIRYIYLGWMEKNLYGVSETKFATYLVPAFRNNSVVIFEVPDQLLSISLAK
ncbi:MAG: DUF2298 domain-containing protein [Leptolinea sp.]